MWCFFLLILNCWLFGVFDVESVRESGDRNAYHIGAQFLDTGSEIFTFVGRQISAIEHKVHR